MKLKYITFGLLCAGLFSCTDDEMGEGTRIPANPGDEILFSAGQNALGVNDTDHPGTRTHYGHYSEEDRNHYAIYWDNGDNIAIYSPQARATESDTPDRGKEQDYKIVLKESDINSQSGTLSKINPSDIGLQWGEEDKHDFFAFYPKETKEGIVNSTTLRLTLPTTQTPSIIRKQSDISGDKIITLPSGNTVSGTMYVAEPNMKSLCMYAHNVGYRTKNEPISLTFKPIPTVLEIILKGPEAGEEPIEVSQVVLRSSQDIVGKFDLTIADINDPKDGATQTVDDGLLSNTLTIPTMYNKQTGATSGENLEPVTLASGDALVVRAFMLPVDFDTNQIGVTVHMVGKGSRTKVLDKGKMTAHTINITEMPKLKATTTNYWMTMLDPNVYFSQLSIPGSHNSYNFPASFTGSEIPVDNNTISPHYQTKNIQQQLETGARAFSFQVGFDTNKFKDAISNDGWEKGQGVYPLYVYAGSEQTQLTLKNVLESYAANLNTLNKKYEQDFPAAGNYGKKAQEFIVLNITFTQRGGPGERQNEVQRWLKELDETMLLISNETFTNKINDQTTIGDLVGKVIVLVNYQGAEWPNHKHQTGGWFPWDEPTYYEYKYTTDKAQNYVVMKETHKEDGQHIDLSGLNDRDYDFLFYQPVQGEGLSNSGINLWRQNLERLNNTSLSVGSWMGNRIQTKKTLITNLFKKAVENNSSGKNVGNWYLNNIGGFEVVNNDRSYNENLGEGGNVVKEAEEINYYTYQYLANPQNNSAPCGVVLMNLFGESEVANTKVYSKELQQIIIDNNYRFPLKVKPSSSAQ